MNTGISNVREQWLMEGSTLFLMEPAPVYKKGNLKSPSQHTGNLCVESFAENSRAPNQ